MILRYSTTISPKVCTRGALLLELLVVVAILASILAVGSQAVFVSMQSGKVSGERDTAVGLAAEALEAVRAVADEKWQNIYNLTKAPQHYYPTLSNGKWVLTLVGDETIALNTASYIRSVVIENVCRDDTTRLVTGVSPCAGGSSDDPSTQRVTVTVSWENADPVVINEYFFRWRNKVCGQTDWSGGVGSGSKNCPDNTYGWQDGNLNTSGGTLKLQ